MSPDEKTYEELLEEFHLRNPRVSQPLAKAHASRQKALGALLDGARLSGLNELLLHLESVADAFDRDEPLRQISFLIRRAAADFEVALEATLGSLVAVAHEAMRDVMEIELLLFDFSDDRARIAEWLNLNDRDRWKKFKPERIRARLRDAEIDRYKGLVRDLDYSAHSEALHVSPVTAVFQKGVQRQDDGGFVRDSGFWEIFEHARRILRAIDRLRKSFPDHDWSCITDADDLILVGDAWARTQQMQEMYLGFLAAPHVLRDELGREPTAREVLLYVRDRLMQQQIDPRLPFAGRPLRRLLWKVFGK